jgi:hypothetical protein
MNMESMVDSVMRSWLKELRILGFDRMTTLTKQRCRETVAHDAAVAKSSLSEPNNRLELDTVSLATSSLRQLPN